jgi:hypothetical protein
LTERAWTAFCAARERYRAYTETLAKTLGGGCIQRLVDGRKGPSYTVETPVLYNYALDEVDRRADVRLILVADNPGRREQAAENRRYLVGPSGKIAEKFFREQLGVDFRRQVLILNKTPIHTPRTAELRELCRLGGESAARAVSESQRVMAELLFAFQKALSPEYAAKPAGAFPSARAALPVWIIGYSEMKKGGLFEGYTETIKSLYATSPLLERLFFYRHFSMNQFTIDLNKQRRPEEDLAPCLKRIGEAYRRRFLQM